MSKTRVIVTGLLLALAAVAGDLKLLRSFAFTGFPAAFDAAPGKGLPQGVWPPAGAEILVPASTTALAIPRLALAATPTAEAATIVILDGMRLDTSHTLPAMNRLRLRGEESVLRVDFPSFSRVGYAGILTGASPLVHGYTSNRKRTYSSVPSIMHVARACGLRTRMFSEHHTWIEDMFAGSFEEMRPLEELIAAGDAIRTAGAPPPGETAPSGGMGPDSGEKTRDRMPMHPMHPMHHSTRESSPRGTLTVVYISEPDLTSHEFGGASPEYKAKALAVDEIVGRIVASIDLSREALWVTTDHGHLDRGGHGGTEEIVMNVPCIAAGRGASILGASSIREIAPRVAHCLGLPRLPGPAVAPPADDPEARMARLCAAFVAIFLLARLLGGAQGPRLRDIGLALLAGLVFLGLYALRGFPFSFSIANKGSEVPRLMAEILLMASIGIGGAALLARGGGTRYAAAVLRIAAVAFAVAFAMAGPTAASAIHAPRASYLVHLTASFLCAAGLLAPILVRVVKNHDAMAEE